MHLSGQTKQVSAYLSARVSFGQVGGVGGDAVGHQPLLHIVLVGQTQVLLQEKMI